MPKRIDPAMRERALNMVAEHRKDYPSMAAMCQAVADKLGIGKETVRRWAVQADIDAGGRASPVRSTRTTPAAVDHGLH